MASPAHKKTRIWNWSKNSKTRYNSASLWFRTSRKPPCLTSKSPPASSEKWSTLWMCRHRCEPSLKRASFLTTTIITHSRLRIMALLSRSGCNGKEYQSFPFNSSSSSALVMARCMKVQGEMIMRLKGNIFYAF